MRSPLILLALALIVGAASCSADHELEESESSAINTVFSTGVSQEDPFVRSETLRVVELVGDPKFTTYAARGLDDESSMVRVASLRATLAVNPSDGGRAAAKMFTDAGPEERRAIVETIADFELGPAQRELLARALRSDDAELRRRAFELHYLQRIDEAVAAKNDRLLESTLFPELGRYVSARKDPVLAAQALRKFVDLGQEDRAEPLIEDLQNEGDLDRRLAAAQILLGAHARPALPAFRSIVEQYDASIADDSLALPTQIVPASLLRLAVLGTVAAGDATYVERARAYFNNVSETEAIEVLEALAPNPTADAALTIKVAMQDARRDVRLRAIELYEEREDADAHALIKALEGTEFETQRRIANVLRDRFREEWIADLSSRVQQISKMEATMMLLRDIVTTREDADALVVPMADIFRTIANRESGRRAALASYFLAITAEGPEASKLVENLDDTTRYAYLEFLVRTSPEGHVDTFRRFLYDDLFAIRLMASAGLWRVLGAAD